MLSDGKLGGGVLLDLKGFCKNLFPLGWTGTGAAISVELGPKLLPEAGRDWPEGGVLDGARGAALVAPGIKDGSKGAFLAPIGGSFNPRFAEGRLPGGRFAAEVLAGGG